MDPAIARFIERMGLDAEGDGFPRIAGRIAGLLVASAEPASLDDLAASLKVSRASVSTNCRLLENLGVADRVSIPGDRRDYYEISQSFPDRFFQVVRAQLDRKVRLADETLAELPEGDSVVRTRMGVYRHLHDFMRAELDAMIPRWQETCCRSYGAKPDTVPAGSHRSPSEPNPS
jgi:DNA-binding transcriptional regulator GbsR (MarR family)